MAALSRIGPCTVAGRPDGPEAPAGGLTMTLSMLVFAAAVAVAPQPAAASPQQPAAPAHDMAAIEARPATLIPGIQGVHFAISTRREEAQKFFDQGLALVYAFNHEEAVRSFRRAAEIDPASPM